MTVASDPEYGAPQITAAYLRHRAVHYRDLMARTGDPRRASRYREVIQMLDAAADSLDQAERHANSPPFLRRSQQDWPDTRQPGTLPEGSRAASTTNRNRD